MSKFKFENITPPTRFVVMSSADKVPSSWKWHGEYRRIAVIETDLPAGEVPKFIGEHAKGCVRVVTTWERQFVGKTERCEFERSWRDAEAMAARMNAKAQIKAIERARKERRNALARQRRAKTIEQQADDHRAQN